MPAIQMARLKTEIESLSAQFQNPPIFIKELRALFEFYAFAVFKPGQAVPPASNLTAYHVPPLVLEQLRITLRPLCAAHPQPALQLTAALWLEDKLEFRLLAASLLGMIPPGHAEQVAERLQTWCTPAEDRLLLRALLEDATFTLRRQPGERWLSVIQSWLVNSDEQQQAVGLLALLPIINESQFSNLPAVFSTIQPLLHQAPTMLHHELQQVLEACLRRSPVETAYFVRQSLHLSNSTGAARIIRRMLHLFPPSTQQALRSLLKDQKD